MNKKILFLTLNIFSSTGGIEKMNRVIGKALFDIGYNVKIFSINDAISLENKYFPSNIFIPFNKNKTSFILKSIKEGVKTNVVILSHINLLVIGCLIKAFSPKTSLILFAHGIEIWKPLSSFKKKMISQCDKVFAVSSFTGDKIKQLGYVNDKQLVVLNNCLDPYLINNKDQYTQDTLLLHHGLVSDNLILLTISRLKSDEKYKGYDKVIKALPKLTGEYPNLRYLIIGKYDEEEKSRLDKMITSLNLKNVVIFTGFVSDEELTQYYNLANLYIMPSLGEGFGIVFIEAMYNGLPVISGNKDGSPDALLNGKLGLMVNPDNQEEIIAAIKKIITNGQNYIPDHKLLMENFSYPVYKNYLEKHLNNLV